MASRKRKERKEEDDDFLGPHLGPVLFRIRKPVMTQEQLAAELEMNAATLRRIESGLGPIRPAVVRDICRILKADFNSVIKEAAAALARDFQRRAAPEGGDAGEPSSIEKARASRTKILATFDARVRSDREMLEGLLDILCAPLDA
jgi:transcriptional regulator with XRE-family HTH domain